MRQRTLVFLTVALLSSWLGCRQTKDYSGFNRFAFEQRPGLGFCPDVNFYYKAVLERSAPDTFTLSGAMLRALPGVEPDQEAAEACSTGIEAGSACMEEVELPSRPLSSQELARVRAVFADVKIEPSPDEKCKTLAIDPCRILSYQWDDSEHTNYVCSANRLDAAQTEVIDLLLYGLRDGG